MAWLLGGSLQDSLVSFERASNLAFKGLTDARYDMEEPDESELTRMAEQAAGPAMLYYRLTGGISDSQRMDQYGAWQAERAPLVISALELAQGIQATPPRVRSATRKVRATIRT